MRVLFFNPSVTRPLEMDKDKMRLSIFFPLGLAYVISYIQNKSNEYDIDTFDALLDGDIDKGHVIDNKIRYGATDDQIEQKIKESKPDVVGVSCLFPSSEYDTINILRITKKINPNIITIVGGVHPTNAAGILLNQYPEIDYIVLGEGEATTLELLEILRKNELAKLSSMPGVAFRDSSGIKVNYKTFNDYIQDIDTIPFPDRDRFNFRRYLEVGEPHANYKYKPFAQMLSSRGCPFQCTYCSAREHWGRRQRYRSPKNVVDEMEILVKEYGVREIHFEDDNFTSNKKRALEIFRLMKERNINVALNCPSGIAIAHLDEELIEAMKEAGFYSISLGIESADEYVTRKLMKKYIDYKKIPRLIETMQRVGIEARGFFILGYPGENEQSIMKTINYAKSLGLDWTYFFIFTPFPNTPIYQTCIEKGYIEEGEYQTDTYNFRRSILRNVDFDPRWLEQVREEAIIDCNFRYNPNRLKGNYEKAIEDIGNVVKLYPHFDFANFYLAETYHDAGQLDKAIEFWKKTLDANPNHGEAKKRLLQYGIKYSPVNTDIKNKEGSIPND